MTEEKIRKIIKCQPEDDAEERLKLIMKLVEEKGREEIANILFTIRNHEISGAISSERRAMAASVVNNPEFVSYIMDTMTRIREKALIDGSDDFLRGQMVALSDAFKFFNMCKSMSNKS
jgi:hypothetical protein